MDLQSNPFRNREDMETEICFGQADEYILTNRRNMGRCLECGQLFYLTAMGHLPEHYRRSN